MSSPIALILLAALSFALPSAYAAMDETIRGYEHAAATGDHQARKKLAKELARNGRTREAVQEYLLAYPFCDSTIQGRHLAPMNDAMIENLRSELGDIETGTLMTELARHYLNEPTRHLRYAMQAAVEAVRLDSSNTEAKELLHLVSNLTQDLLRRLRPNPELNHPILSPDGRYLIIYPEDDPRDFTPGNKVFRVFDLDHSQSHSVNLRSQFIVNPQAQFSSLGKYFGLATDFLSLENFKRNDSSDIAAAPFLASQPIGNSGPIPFAFSADERFFTVIIRINGFRFWNIDLEGGGHTEWIVPGIDKDLELAKSMTWSPQGKLAIGTSSGKIKVLDFATRKAEFEITLPRDQTVQVQFDPTGRYLGVVSNSRVFALFSAADGSPVVPAQQIPNDTLINAMKFTLDGKAWLLGDNRGYIRPYLLSSDLLQAIPASSINVGGSILEIDVTADGALGIHSFEPYFGLVDPEALLEQLPHQPGRRAAVTPYPTRPILRPLPQDGRTQEGEPYVQPRNFYRYLFIRPEFKPARLN